MAVRAGGTTMKRWVTVPNGLLALSVGLTIYGLKALFFPSYNEFGGCEDSGLAVHLLVIGMVGIGFVAWLKR
jgi:hypothetical protein